MDIREKLKIIREGWTETVKPYINNGDFNSALSNFESLSTLVQLEPLQFAQYHSGITWVASVHSLGNALREGAQKEIQDSVKKYETYFAQLSLSTRTANTFS